MNHEKIVEGLRSWMRVSTWDTHHPLDQQRFHHALKDVFDACGPLISGDKFESAMRELATELGYRYPSNEMGKTVSSYASTAENIGSYLHDNRNR